MQQQQALKAKLRYRHVRTRASNGTPISYVEGWHVIAEANRIFGYDSWDRQTLSPRCLWRETQHGETACFYAAKVRVTVRAGEAIIVREGVGTGFGRSRTAETAHEIALKAAETDATKRALGDLRQSVRTSPLRQRAERRDAGAPNGMPRQPTAKLRRTTVVFDLLHTDARTERFTSAEAFVAATVQAVRALTTVEAVYAFWEANLDSFAALPRAKKTAAPILSQRLDRR